MAFTEGGSNGVLNNTSDVTIVSNPSSGVKRVVRTIVITNNDTVNVTLHIRLRNTSTVNSTIWLGELEPGDAWEFGENGAIIVLDSTSKSIIASLSGAVTTTQPSFIAGYGDRI